jgi:hypothetical protein
MTEFGVIICVYGEICTKNTNNKNDKDKLLKTSV